jgi:hypothetical protein
LEGYGAKTVKEIERLLRSHGLSMRGQGEVAVRGLYQSRYAQEQHWPVGKGDLYDVVEIAIDHLTKLPCVVYRELPSSHPFYGSESLRVEWEIDFLRWTFNANGEVARPGMVLYSKFH